jgi:hypothetical protein
MGLRIGCALAGIAMAFAAFAQPAPRIRGQVMAFDGKVLTLQPDGTTADTDWVRIAVRPDTRYVSTEKYRLSDIKPGDFAGAGVIPEPDGKLRAQEVHVYPGALRGSGEGRFAEGPPGRLMINGTVAAERDGALTLHYRGAALDNGICKGRLPVPITPGACAGDAVITVAPGVPVTALAMGDKDIVVPGATAVVSIVTAPDGSKFTPGLIVEKPAASP